MVNTSSSTLLAGALATFSKTAHETLTKVEDQARIEVARALSETRAAQGEHQDAMKMLHAAQMETQELKQQVISCKAALKQAELTTAHQNELLSQLRRDVTQWKDQSRNWQDHFLRVEQERCALSTRMDELIIDRLQEPSSISQYTPKAQYNDGYPPTLQKPSNPGTGNGQDTVMQRLKPPRSNRSVSPSRSGRSILIRRVNAVVHVKQEDSENELSTSVEDEIPVVKPRRRSESRRRIRKAFDEVAGSGPDEHKDDDDELAMGAEDNHHELYGTQPITATKTPTASSKKRKLGATGEKSATKRKLG